MSVLAWPGRFLATKHQELPFAVLGANTNLCTARGIQHLPAAFNAYGGWGEEIPDKLVEPFFNRLRAEERAATGSTEQNTCTLAKREF